MKDCRIILSISGKFLKERSRVWRLSNCILLFFVLTATKDGASLGLTVEKVDKDWA